MKPTILIGDRFLADKIRSLKEIKREEVVVFHSPLDKTKFVKRVIGLPGERIRIVSGVVYINDHELEEKYINKTSPQGSPAQDAEFGPIMIPEDSFFVLGDNRNNSRDSRHYESIPFQSIIGRVNVILWSWDPQKSEMRWERINKKVE